MNDPNRLAEGPLAVVPLRQVVHRPEEKNDVDAVIGHVEISSVPLFGGHGGPAEFILDSFDVSRRQVNDVNAVAGLGQP